MEGESENNKEVYWKKKDREKNMQYQENSSDRVQSQEESDLALKVESRKVVFESPDVEVIETIYIDENGERKKDYEMVKKQGHSINKNSFALSNEEKNIMDIIKKNGDLEAREKNPSFNQGNPNMVFTPPSSHPAEESQVHPKNVIPQHNREHPTVDVPMFIPVDTFIPPKIVKQGDIEVPEEIEGEIRQSRDLDFYPLNEPYAFARIYFNSENQEREYIVIEPPLNNFEKEKLKFIQDILIKGLDINLEELEEKGAQRYLRESIERIIRDYEISLDSNSKEKIFYYVVRDFLGYGKIDALMKDPNIEDISCDGPGTPVFLYHRKYGSLKTNIVFEDEEELSAFVIKLAQKCGKHISIAEPMIDATLPDGSRIQMTLSTEVTTKGSTFTIRKFRADPFTPVDLVEFGTMSAEMVAYMWICVEHGANALFAGGTASGKTTSLNALSLFIPPQSKIVSVEETREINLPHPNWIPGLTRIGFGEVVDNRKVGEIDMYDLVKTALRQRPEYIIVGEIRGKEAYVLFQAMATGHTTYSTIHADSPQSLIHRLEGKPIEIPRIMLQSLDLVLFHASVKVRGKRARRCKQIVEIVGIDPNTKEVLTNEVFRWIPEKDQFDYSGKSYILERIRGSTGMSREDMDKELRIRTEIINWMVRRGVKSYKEFAKIVSEYYEDPKTLLYKMRREMSGAK
ncbi:MAG: secretion system protein E [Thermoplasmata archaeon]|nr:MAG: secretion system protein E [Thermoplasmata archaeon]